MSQRGTAENIEPHASREDIAERYREDIAFAKAQGYDPIPTAEDLARLDARMADEDAEWREIFQKLDQQSG